MRFGSVCSGIEAASVAWHPLGWEAAWLSEIEPFPSAVLRHHYPDVPNLGDMTTLPDRIASGEVEAPDLFCGGTPCQAFSVAGLRKSLDDARGNLSLVFCEIANAIDTIRLQRQHQPAVIFWENVPGVLSTKDNAFGCFLGALAGEVEELEPPGGKWTNAGCVSGPTRTVAWRVLDAQYFGVAQRRRRVFVVASARTDFDPTSVLFELDGVRRDSAPSREARQSIAGGIEIGPGGGRFTDLNPTLDTRAKDGPIRNQLAGAVIAPMGRPDLSYSTKLHNTQSNQAGKVYEEYATSLDANSPPPAVFQPVAFVQNSRDEVRMMGGDGSLVGALAAETGAKQQCYVAQPIAFPANLSATQHATTENLAPALGAKNPTAVAFGMDGDVMHDGLMETITTCEGFITDTSHAVAVAFNMHKSGNEASSLGISVDKTDCLRAFEKSPFAVQLSPTMQVRRLTPVECERLQGFPDGYTMIPWRKKLAEECPDGPRYKALGNSWAVPNVRWIGARIENEIIGGLV